MSENKKIDVLAVIDNYLDPDSPHQPHDLREARTAIAELIDAAKGIGSPGGKPDWIESRRDRMKWARLDIFERDWLRFTTALARVAANTELSRAR